ncbi:MAG TPA: FliH/SctL family protein [Cellvibrionaceae bacterium]|nr:FliH/SctL family protein [Cellvibrionaceae bacterium]
MSKLPGRIPFEDVEKFRNWAVPKVSGQVLASAEREAKKAQMANLPKQDHETVEEIAAEQVSFGPMTAEQLAQITEEASREGFNQGYEEGLEKGLATGERQGQEQGKTQALAEWSGRLKEQVEQLATTCEALLDPLGQQHQRLTEEMLNLSVLLAEQLLQRELSQNPAAYWGWLQEALAQLPAGRKDASLFLPTEVIDLLRTHQPPQLQQLTLVADDSLPLGAYRIEAGPSQVVFNAAERLRQWLNEVQPKAELAPELKTYEPPQTASAPTSVQPDSRELTVEAEQADDQLEPQPITEPSAQDPAPQAIPHDSPDA